MPIECNNLTKSYDGKLVIDHCTATIPEIGVTSIMGPSGVGKTRFLRLLAGLEKADSGHISGLSRKKLSVVFQEDRAVSPTDGAGKPAGRGFWRRTVALSAGSYESSGTVPR